MTFLHRLAHRIARLKALVLALTSVALACSQGEQADFLSPVPNQPNNLHSVQISPRIAAIQAGSEFRFTATALSRSGAVVPASFDWSAESGTISSDGRFVGVVPGPFRVTVRAHDRPELSDTAVIAVWQNETDPTGITIQPQDVSLEEGDSLTFSAFLNLANGVQAAGATVDWSATGGQINSSGYYVAPTAGSYLVSARTVNGYSGTASIRVRRRSALVAKVTINPETTRLAPGQGLQFTATTVYSDGKSAPGSYLWSATGGTITQTGAYTAAAEGDYKVVVVGAGALFADTATVSVVNQAPSLASLRISPKPVTIQAGGVQQFYVIGAWSDGTTGQPMVTWTATGGSMTPGGLYTAGSVAGTYRVIAVHQGGTLADTSAVTVQPPSVVALGISPKNASVQPGRTQQFTASATWSNGSTVLPSVTWTATGGTVSSGGLYAAGNTTGTYRVILSGGGRADTATVNVGAPRALVSLGLAPKSAQVGIGGTQQFSVSALWSDGSTTLPVLSWSATGGTISSTGLYAAGSTAGTYRVIASGGGKADTATVSVSAPATPAPAGCASPQPGWIWCDDFEQDRLSSYFEYDNSGGSFVRVAGVGTNESNGMRAQWKPGQVGAGNLKLAFGRTPSSYMRPVDAGTANYREIYWRMYVKNQPGWTGGGGDKLSRAAIMAGSNWQEAMIAHVWSGGPGSQYLLMDPASGTDLSGVLKTTKYNDFTNLRWLGETPGQVPLFDASHVGQWHCVEAHARLNTAGQSDGLMELWIDGVLDARRTGVNWVGSYGAYGINVVFFENYWNDGSPVAQERYFDDIVVSTQPIGCNGGSSPPANPANPTVTSFTISPKNVTLAVGGSQQFQTSTVWSDGQIRSSTVTYGATGGTMLGGLYLAGQIAGTFSVIATCSCGRSDTAQVVLTVSQGNQPALVEDFSAYGSTADLLSNSRGIYGNDLTVYGNQIVLDPGNGLNAGGYALSRSMRFDLNATGQCDEGTVAAAVKIPGVDRTQFGAAAGQNIKDVWWEVWVKYGNGFSLQRVPGCSSPSDHKTVLTTFNRDGYGRADFHIYGDANPPTITHSIAQSYLADPASDAVPSVGLWDGRWHQIRVWQHLPSGALGPAAGKIWIDGVLVYNRSDLVMAVFPGYQPEPYPGFSMIRLGNNYGTPRSNQQMWWGRIAVWTSNPGW